MTAPPKRDLWIAQRFKTSLRASRKIGTTSASFLRRALGEELPNVERMFRSAGASLITRAVTDTLALQGQRGAPVQQRASARLR